MEADLVKSDRKIMHLMESGFYDSIMDEFFDKQV